MEDEDAPALRRPMVQPTIRLGDKLEGRSVGELEDYKTALAAEIQRVDAEIAGRRSHLAAAEALFKKP